MIDISTSILSVKKENSARTFYDLESAKTDYFHIDVMDGKFVERDTTALMKEYTMEIKHISNTPLDVHLMVEDIRAHVDEYLEFKPNIITIHFEAAKEKTMEYINYIKENNIKVGISIKPDTKLEEIYEFLPFIHMCLIMTVEPGKGGQALILKTISKIKELKKYIIENNIEIDIEVDGGINLETAKSVKQAGANILVVGSAIINTGNFKDTICKLKGMV